MLQVGGYTPLSTTDWPDRLAAVVFIQGCPWRCHYCHNPELQPRDGEPGQPHAARPGWPELLQRLGRRVGLLDGVVFSGGEPTLDPGLLDAAQAVRSLGLRVGLHTAGIYPKRLQALLPLLDWVGLDLKTDLADYERVTGVPGSGGPALRSLQLVMASGVDCEVRTTWHPRLIPDDALLRLAALLRDAGIRRWVLQRFRPVTRRHHEQLGSVEHAPEEGLLDRLRQALGTAAPSLAVR